jgi:hypothetical protein
MTIVFFSPIKIDQFILQSKKLKIKKYSGLKKFCVLRWRFCTKNLLRKHPQKSIIQVSILIGIFLKLIIRLIFSSIDYN